MDKEILRIVIIASGLLIMLAMVVWAYIKDKKDHEEIDFYDDQNYDYSDDFDIELIDTVTIKNTDSPVFHAVDNSTHDQVITREHHHEPISVDDDDEPQPRPVAPAIIQFCILAKADEGFNGLDLLHAFTIAGLEYGSLKIFERLDDNRLVDFGVACMTAPGTFPKTDLESFYCQGLVFFMQPGVLDDPLSVFEDYIETIRMLAIELDGEILDHEKKPLSDAAIQSLRQSL
jgi:cell division protein ZipA